MSETTTTTPPPLRIIKLEAESFKRLRAVSITPEGTIIQITGRNGQGKSSVLDAIAGAIGGTRLAPERPVRKGHKSAEVTVDLGEIVVRRRYTEGGTSLEVMAKDGSKLPTPQAVLDKLVGDLTFDPLAFSRLADKDRLQVLRNTTGLGKVFDGMNAVRDRNAEERRVLNARIKALEANLAAVPQFPPGTPATPVSVAQLAQEHAQGTAIVADNAERRQWLAKARESVEAWRARVDKARADLANAEHQLASVVRIEAEHAAEIQALVDPDLGEIQAKMRSAEDVNRAVAAKTRRAEIDAELLKARREAAANTGAIEQVEADKEQALADAKIPVKGMTFTDAGVLLNGMPWAQASTAEQLRASVAMGLAQNPRLRVMLVREGSLLDSQSMAALEAIAAEHEAQVWVESVTDGEQVGIVIEDGEVREGGAA